MKLVDVLTSGELLISLWVGPASTVDDVLAICGDFQDLAPGRQRLALSDVLLESGRNLADYGGLMRTRPLRLVDTRRSDIGEVERAASEIGGAFPKSVPTEGQLCPPLPMWEIGPPVPKASLVRAGDLAVSAGRVPAPQAAGRQNIPKWKRFGLPIRESLLVPKTGGSRAPVHDRAPIPVADAKAAFG